MSIFRNQFANVVEWEEFRDDMIFYKWRNREIKKGSRLIIRPGQDAIFLNNGRIEGVFQDDGEYDIESQIIPFLSTL
ncbi:SPFH domain-containing protein, partial [Heyndrickxia sporothermodurans]